MTESWVPLPPESSPGWHADPWFTGQYRWWDGSAWSGDVFPAGVAPYGSGPVVSERPPYERPPSPPPSQRATPPPPPPTWVIQNIATPDVAPTVIETLEQQPSRPRLNAPAILALLLALGIVLGTTIGLLTTRHPSKRVAAVIPPSSLTPSIPPSRSVPAAPPSPSQAPSAAPFQAPSEAPSGTSSDAPSGAQPAVPPGLSTNGLLQRFSLRQSDLPPGQQLALIPGGDTVKDPTLDLCNGTYASEKRRVARLQVMAETADGSTPISSEAVLYDSPAGTAQAFAELKRITSSCPSTPVTSPVGEATITSRFGPSPDRNWPTVAGVQRLAYALTTTDAAGDSSSSTVIYLRRGKALLGLYLPTPDTGAPRASVQGKTSAADIAAIFEQRLAALPASAIGA